jgi:polyhydroxyalkanoate synthesis regulator phasin
MDKRKKDAEKAEDEVSKRVEEVLDRMNVPTKADIEALGEKITSLSKKVDELKKTPVA